MPTRSTGEIVSTAGPASPWAEEVAGLPWLRGNVHCHTTESDGRFTPQQTVDWFAGAGYQFLALTDHNRITDPALLDPKGMVLLPSTELSAAGGELGATYHLLGLGLSPSLTLPAVSTPAPVSVRWLRDHGAVVYVAHPHWSGLTVADVVNAGAHGLEIYNGGTVLDSQKGEALVHWDELSARGASLWGIATDDTHWHTIDRGLGWVMVRAREQTAEGIVAALSAGCFYATCGPEIQQVRLSRTEDGMLSLYVETSPCAAIYALSPAGRSQFHFDREAAARGEPGATITTASFTLDHLAPGEMVRVQCTDWQRRSAWSNPLVVPGPAAQST